MKYNRLYKEDMVNGEGVRTTLFVSGCEHACKGCYNQITWNKDHGHEFTRETMQEILESLEPDYVKGLSLSGGDPLHPANISQVYQICLQVKRRFPNKDIWMWTGYTKSQIMDSEDPTDIARRYVLRHVDVLIDGKFEQDKYDPTLKWRGSSNQIIHVKEIGG